MIQPQSILREDSLFIRQIELVNYLSPAFTPISSFIELYKDPSSCLAFGLILELERKVLQIA